MAKYDGQLFNGLTELVERIVMCEDCGESLWRVEINGRKLCRSCADNHEEPDPNQDSIDLRDMRGY